MIGSVEKYNFIVRLNNGEGNVKRLYYIFQQQCLADKLKKKEAMESHDSLCPEGALH